MKRFVTVVFVGFTSFCIAQKNDTPLEFVSETNEIILLTFVNDSLKIEYPLKGMKEILLLDEAAMEVEGTPFYVGVLKSDSSNCEITVQFLEENECTVDSDCESLTKGICKLKEKNPFGVYQSSFPGKDDGNGSGARYVRRMIQKPNTDRILTDETCIIVLKVRIDQDGNVVGIPTAVSGQTTTTNMVLIRKVIEVVKNEAKYAKSNGKAMESMTIKVRLEAN